jgi:putative endonuclease
MSAHPSAARGRWGEDLARAFLEQCGFVCRAARYRAPGGEIDLVMARGPLLVFVEVKVRGARRRGAPEAAVSPAKLMRLRRAARHYLYRYPSGEAWELRFDVVAIDHAGEGRGLVLRHLAGVR